MGAIYRFEDIKAWQLAREIVRNIYRVTQRSDFSKDYGLKDQIRRAAVSIMSNIAEGFERRTDKELVQFLSIAKGSSAEVRSQLYIAVDLGYIPEKDFESLKQDCELASKQIASFMKYLKLNLKV